MSFYYGDFPVNGVVDFKWNTSGQDGASITRSTDGTLRIYKNNSATERTSLAGVTQTEDFDSTTGLHHIRIDLSDNTDAGFYVAGSEISVVMAGMVIDTKTVNAEIACFSIERTGGALALIKARLVGTIATGTHNPQGGDTFARLGAPVGASISADIATRATQTSVDAIDTFLDTEVVSVDEMAEALVGPQATVVANGANTATTFQVTITTVTEAAADWWKDAWFSFDLNAALAGQTKRIANFNQSTGMITMASAFTNVPTAGNTARLVTR